MAHVAHFPCRKEILGIILVKELVLIDNNARTRVADLRMRSLPYLRADTAMYDLLKLFQTGRSHMVVLTKPPDAADGTVSRANSQDVSIQIEEAQDRVSPEVTALHAGQFGVSAEAADAFETT